MDRRTLLKATVSLVALPVVTTEAFAKTYSRGTPKIMPSRLTVKEAMQLHLNNLIDFGIPLDEMARDLRVNVNRWIEQGHYVEDWTMFEKRYENRLELDVGLKHDKGCDFEFFQLVVSTEPVQLNEV